MDQPTYQCNLDLPYPPIRVSGTNPAYAKMLLTPMAGSDSELGAILTYGFQSVIFGEKYPEVSAVLSCISNTEMRHYAILSQFVKLLGVEPRVGAFQHGKFRYYDASHVNYDINLQTALEADRRDEQNASKEYERLAMEIGDADVSRMLTRISRDEEHHAKLLDELIAKLQ